MSSAPCRDAVTDYLLTPGNATPVVVDHQSSQVQAVTSMDREVPVDGMLLVARLERVIAVTRPTPEDQNSRRPRGGSVRRSRDDDRPRGLRPEPSNHTVGASEPIPGGWLCV